MNRQLEVTFKNGEVYFYPADERGWASGVRGGRRYLLVGYAMIPEDVVERWRLVEPAPVGLVSIAGALAAGRCPGCDRPFDDPGVSCRESAGGGWVCSRSAEAAPDPVEVEEVVRWAEQQARRCPYTWTEDGQPQRCEKQVGHRRGHEPRRPCPARAWLRGRRLSVRDARELSPHRARQRHCGPDVVGEDFLMSGETTLTIIGNLTADPELRFTPAGAAVASFTVASTPRHFDRQSNEWKDGDALFIRCSVWRQAAENVAESLSRGMRVIVQGRLQQRSFETREGEKRTVIELQVDEVGPSLKYATATVNRTQRGSAGVGHGGFAPSGGDDPWSSGSASSGFGGGDSGWSDDNLPF